ncbi:MAG: SoxR reducing system RseC family protein [Candidatus Latescibacteria bacterium]|nr:SoxR reducing system RseC family protein [Candidatus Latescibacterota bacterium]
MEEVGKIIELVNDKARIEITPSGGCNHCTQAHICNPFGKNKKIIELPNSINAQVNDLVKIEIKDKNRFLSILLVLGLPILLFLIGIIIGNRISGDALAALFGGIGLLLAFIIVKIVNNYLLRTNKNLACIKEKIESNTD